jgi:two-component system response regulator HydG
VSYRILLVDDDAPLCDTLAIGLGKRGYSTASALSAADAIVKLSAEDFDVVVTDLNMRGTGGIELCERIVANRPDIPVVVLTAFGSLDTAVSAIRAGAYDFISKPVELDVLAIAIHRAAKHRELGEEVRRLRREAVRSEPPPRFVGQSSAMRSVYDLIERVADSATTVLVTGESGTGKELVASALHAASGRRDRPFVTVNCATLPEAVLDAELFGLAASPGSGDSERRGVLLEADGGTLFLDEIGELPAALQPKLLRVLQERAVSPAGNRSGIPIDVRVIAATNRDLESAIEEGRFREDLYYRINVVHIDLPPLRSRPGDVLPLAHHFLRQFAARAEKAILGISPAAAEKLVAYKWPGNVRELQNCVERSVALARFDHIGVDDLPEKVRAYRSSHVLVAGDDPSELVPMEELERRYIARVMDAVGGNKTAAARILGLDRKRLYRMIDRLGLGTPKTS